MSFYVRNSGKSGWTVVKQSYEDKKRRQKAVPKEAYSVLGLRKSMTIDEARERCRRLNKEKSNEKWSAVRAANKLKELQLIESIHIPKDLAEEFQDWLIENHSINSKGRMKVLSHWKQVQKLLKTVQILPDQYYSKRRRIFRYFAKNQFSLDYSRKVIRILNQFGEFVCEYQGQFFKPVPKMTVHQANEIRDSYFASKTYQGESEILTPQILEKIKDNLKTEQYRWLYISVWTGLRPREIDLLKQGPSKEKYFILNQMINDKMTPVLKVYQSKLVSVQREKRWKYIPLFHEKQRVILDYLNSELKRPLNKTLKKLTKMQITCYGGRKGFASLMLDEGQDLEDISAWLGHSSIEMTWKVYRNKKRVNFKKVG